MFCVKFLRVLCKTVVEFILYIISRRIEQFFEAFCELFPLKCSRSFHAVKTSNSIQ